MSYGKSRLGAYGRGSRLGAYGLMTTPSGTPSMFPGTPSRISNAYGLSGRQQIVAPTSGRGPMSGYGRPGSPSQLGILPAIAIPLIQAGGKILGGLFTHDNKDPIRLAQNQTWYTAAIAGDAAALAQLEAHSHGVSVSGSVGWATGTAAADAAAKYAQAVAALNAQRSGPGVSLMPVPPSQPAVLTANIDPVSAFFQAFTSTPGGQQATQQVVTAALPAVTQAARTQAGATIGAGIVNNPMLVAGAILSALALTATLASRGGRRGRR
jgi:hypothetical protein